MASCAACSFSPSVSRPPGDNSDVNDISAGTPVTGDEPVEKYSTVHLPGEVGEAFDDDVRWLISNTSEYLHKRIFLIELFCQTSYGFFGPVSFPWMYVVYGINGMKNRGFLPNHDGRAFYNSSFVAQTICWATMATSLYVWFAIDPPDVMLAELKMAVIATILRYATVAIKYAYLTTDKWSQLNSKVCDTVYLRSLLIINAWNVVAPDIMSSQAENSFIAVIGPREDRSRLAAQFLPWPRSSEELTSLRKRVTTTSRNMYYTPTGHIKERAFGRRISREKDWSLDDAKSLASDVTEERQDVCSRGGSSACDIDEETFERAAAGNSVGIERLFLYILRGVLRSEKHHWYPQTVLFLLFVFSIVFTISPGITRAVAGKRFTGATPEATIVIILLWPSAFFAHFGNINFVLIGAKDMWRRRALMRSCSALLSFRQEYRRGCPAEVQLLPALELADPTTVEAWLLLRRLCLDWGRYYFYRIQAFISVFFFFSLLAALDLIASMQIRAYTLVLSLSIADFVVTGLYLLQTLTCIVLYVYFGEEVNEAAAMHTHLLQHQRLQLTISRYKASSAYAPVHQRRTSGRLWRVKSESGSRDIQAEPEQNPWDTCDFIDVLCNDLEAEQAVHPVRVLGAYCGLSLLSALYVIPTGIISMTISFCSKASTRAYCLLPA